MSVDDIEDIEVYKVGGAVRDELLGADPHDEDFVVIGETPESMREHGFGPQVGNSFGVFLHPQTYDEWVLAQRSSSSDTVPAEQVSLYEDLKRRDLTMNSIAKDIETGEYIDPFNGQQDIEQKIIRHTSSKFVEDPIRVLRVARFAARYPEFTIDAKTKSLCIELGKEILSIAGERIRLEFEKLFEYAQKPRRFFDVLNEFDALKYISPVFTKLSNTPAGPEEHHQEGSVLEHTLQVIEQAHQLDATNPNLLWAALGHDMGKINTPKKYLPNHPNHDTNGLKVIDTFTADIPLTNMQTQTMKRAAKHHMRVKHTPEMNAATLLKFASQLNNHSLSIDELLLLYQADGLGRTPKQHRTNITTLRKPLEQAKTAKQTVSGSDILEQFDVDNTDGEKIRQLLQQERINTLQSLQNNDNQN